MRWKNLSSWLKGGIIGAAVGIFLVLLSELNHLIAYYTHISLVSYFPLLGDLRSLVHLPMFPVLFLGYFLSWAMPFPLVVVSMAIINAILYGIIGSFIGWIVGKIKNK